MLCCLFRAYLLSLSSILATLSGLKFPRSKTSISQNWNSEFHSVVVCAHQDHDLVKVCVYICTYKTNDTIARMLAYSLVCYLIWSLFCRASLFGRSEADPKEVCLLTQCRAMHSSYGKYISESLLSDIPTLREIYIWIAMHFKWYSIPTLNAQCRPQSTIKALARCRSFCRNWICSDRIYIYLRVHLHPLKEHILPTPYCDQVPPGPIELKYS